MDPGIRKFLVGYDPTGESIFIGEGASLELTKLLYEVDVIENPKKKHIKTYKKTYKQHIKSYKKTNKNIYNHIKNI